MGFLTGLLGISVGGTTLAQNPMAFLEVIVFLNVLIAIWTIAFQRNKLC